jgi:cell envelope opacity-associated protein A
MVSWVNFCAKKASNMRTKQQYMRGVAMKLTAIRALWDKLRAKGGDKLTTVLEQAATLSRHSAMLTRIQHAWRHLPRLHRRLLMILVPVVVVLALLPSPTPPESSSDKPVRQARQPVAINPDASRSLSSSTASQNASPVADSATSQKASTAEESAWTRHQIESGDTLAKVFRRYDLALTDLYSIANIEGEGKPISRIQPGQWIRFKRTSSGALDILQIETEKGQSALYFRLSDGGFARQR